MNHSFVPFWKFFNLVSLSESGGTGRIYTSKTKSRKSSNAKKLLLPDKSLSGHFSPTKFPDSLSPSEVYPSLDNTFTDDNNHTAIQLPSTLSTISFDAIPRDEFLVAEVEALPEEPQVHEVVK